MANDYPDWMEDDDQMNDSGDLGSWGNSSDDMTYDEWERQQEEAAKPPPPPSPEVDEVPDWFHNIDGQPAAPANIDAGSVMSDYVPEWFMGVEELSEDDAPDWLKEAPPTAPPQQPHAAPAPAQVAATGDDEDAFLDSILGDDAPPAEEAPPDDAPVELDFLDDDDEAPVDLGLLDDEEDAVDTPLAMDFLLDDEEEAADEAPIALDFLDDDEPVDLGLLDEQEPAALDEEPALDLDFLEGDDSLEPEIDLGEAISLGIEDGEALDLGLDDMDALDLGLDDRGDLVLGEALDLGLDAAEDDLSAGISSGGDTGWLEEIDFSELQEPDSQAGSVEEAMEAGLDLGSGDLDLDSLLGGSDVTLPTGETALDGGEMQLDALDSLSFDDEFLSDFPTGSTEEETQDDVSLADLEPADIDEELLEMPDMEGIAVSEDMPEWMSQMVVSEETVALHVGGIVSQFEQVPDITLPADLRTIREHITGHLKQTKRDQETPNSGPLAGIEGAVRFDPRIAEAQLMASYGLTEAQEAHLASLQRVLHTIKQEATQVLEAEVEDKVEETVPLRARLLQSIQWERLLISIILMAVVVLPVVTDSMHLADDPPDTLDDSGSLLAGAVDGLISPAGSADVLFAFEYAPQASGELDPLVDAVLRDVLVNGGRPVILSTGATGTLNAQRVIEDLRTDPSLLAALDRETPLNSPDDYIMLRYLPGGAVGVRALAAFESFASPFLAEDLRGNETGLTPGQLDSEDFAFVVVVGERVEDMRIWSEQFGEAGLPMYALVTAAAEPVTRAYVSSGRYRGMLAGVRGTLMYTSERAVPLAAPAENVNLPDTLISRWHSTALGALAAAILIGVGSVLGLIVNLRRRR